MSGQVKALTEEWVAALAEASLDVVSVHAIDTVIEFTRGKKTSVAVQVRDGRVVGLADAEAAVALSVPATSSQMEAFVTGAESMSRAYSRGDFKPVGSTGSLIALLALFEDRPFRERLAVSMGLG